MSFSQLSVFLFIKLLSFCQSLNHFHLYPWLNFVFLQLLSSMRIYEYKNLKKDIQMKSHNEETEFLQQELESWQHNRELLYCMPTFFN